MAIVWETHLSFDQFRAAVEGAIPIALERGAEYARTITVPKVPFIVGELRRSGGTRVTGTGMGSQGEVSFNTVYAAFQEYGSWPDGTHIVKRHSEAGTQTHFLRDGMIEATDGVMDIVADTIARLS